MRVADIFGPGDVWVEDPQEPTNLALADAIIRRRCQALDGRQAIKVLLSTEPLTNLDRSRVSHDNQ